MEPAALREERQLAGPPLTPGWEPCLGRLLPARLRRDERHAA